MSLETRTCEFCGAMSQPSFMATPHNGQPCPLRVAEHELRMEILAAELESIRSHAEPQFSVDVSVLRDVELAKLSQAFARLAARGVGARA